MSHTGQAWVTFYILILNHPWLNWVLKSHCGFWFIRKHTVLPHKRIIFYVYCREVNNAFCSLLIIRMQNLGLTVTLHSWCHTRRLRAGLAQQWQKQLLPHSSLLSRTAFSWALQLQLRLHILMHPFLTRRCSICLILLCFCAVTHSPGQVLYSCPEVSIWSFMTNDAQLIFFFPPLDVAHCVPCKNNYLHTTSPNSDLYNFANGKLLLKFVGILYLYMK